MNFKEAAILVGDQWREAFCTVNNLISNNKASVEKKITYEEPKIAGSLNLGLGNIIFINRKIKHVDWKIVFRSEGA